MKRNTGETAGYSLESRTRQASGQRGHNHRMPEEASFASSDVVLPQVRGNAILSEQASKGATGKEYVEEMASRDAAALRRAPACGG